MSTVTSSYDWKKVASTVLNTDEVEKEFASQAYSTVAQRAGKLLEPAHFLGFELIHANEDKNKLVGIFAFRVDRELIYAPVFFLNGKIKGQELLYRVGPSLFVPFTEPWVKELTKKSNATIGKGQDRSRLNKLPTGADLSPLIFPRRTNKQASVVLQSSNPTATQEDTVADLIDSMTSMEKWASYIPGSLLRQFIVEDGGRPALGYIAELIKSSAICAEAIMQAIDGDMDMLIPPELQDAPVVKTASVSKPLLVLHTGGVKNASIKNEDLDSMFKCGFAIEDNRDPDKLTTIYEDAGSWEEISSPGVYNVPVVDADGPVEVVVVHVTHVGGGDSVGSLIPARDYEDDSASVELGLVFAKPKLTYLEPQYYGMRRSVMGKLSSKTVAEVLIPLGDKKPKVNKAYLMFDTRTHTAASHAYFIKDVSKTSTGVTAIEIQQINQSYARCNSVNLIINEDAPRTDWKLGILNADVIYIPLDLEKNENNLVRNNETDKVLADVPRLMPMSAFVSELARGNFNDSYLAKRKIDDKYEIKVGSRKGIVVFETVKSAAAYLAHDCRIPGAAVMELVEQLVDADKVKFVLGAPENVKAAYGVTTLLNHPQFTTDYDSVLQVPTEAPQSFTLDTETAQPPIREIPLNETWDPSGGNTVHRRQTESDDALDLETLLSASPGDIKNLQKSKDLPFAFEHGVLGSMVKTFDAAAVIDKYIPALETGLDRMGRILFLFYWKPQDFEKAFGVDTMADKEQELISCFKAHGDLVLSLRQRNKNEDEGSPSLGKR